MFKLGENFKNLYLLVCTMADTSIWIFGHNGRKYYCLILVVIRTLVKTINCIVILLTLISKIISDLNTSLCDKFSYVEKY